MVLPTAWITSVIVPAVRVEVGDRERDALAVFVLHDDDELARLGRPRHHRVADFEQVRDVGEILPCEDFEVRHEPALRYSAHCPVGAQRNTTAALAAAPFAGSILAVLQSCPETIG